MSSKLQEPEPERWYTITLGSSFTESPAPKRFRSLRYEFKPASIDSCRGGSMHKSKENKVTVEFNNNQAGKPKLTFQGTSEDCKELDAALFFDGRSLRLERLHRSVKCLRHVRLPGEHAAVAAAAAAAEARSPPPPKAPPKGNAFRPSVNVSALPIAVERIDVGEPNSSSPGDKKNGRSIADEMNNLSPHLTSPEQKSPAEKSADENEHVDIEEEVDVDVDGDVDVDVDVEDEGDTQIRNDGLNDGQEVNINVDENAATDHDSDEDSGDVDIGDDHDEINVGEPLGTQLDTEAQQSSSSSESSGSQSSGSASATSSSESEGSDDDSASSGHENNS